MQDTAGSDGGATLVATFVGLLLEYRGAVKQKRTFHRLLALTFGMLWSPGRHTVTQALLAIGCFDADWSPFYRRFSRERIPITSLHTRLLQQCLTHVAPDQPLMLAVDGVAFPRSSLRFPG